MRYQFFVAVVSYSLEENLTTGLVVAGLGSGDNLGDDLLTSRAYICHPMLVPTLVLLEAIRDMTGMIDNNSGDVDSLEENVGLRAGYRENEEFMRQAEEALRIGTDVRACLSNCRGYTALLGILLESMLKAIPYVDDKAGFMDTGPLKTARQHELQRCADVIRGKIESLRIQTDCLLRSIDNLADRAALQTSAVSRKCVHGSKSLLTKCSSIRFSLKEIAEPILKWRKSTTRWRGIQQGLPARQNGTAHP